MDAQIYSLADTAVKIGLGAIISGGFALWAVKSREQHETKIAADSQQHEYRKSSYNRRLERLESISKCVEEHYGHFLRVWAFFRIHDKELPKKVTDPVPAKLAKELNETGERFKSSGERIIDAEGYAMLLGETELAAKLKAFRRTVGLFQSGLVKWDDRATTLPGLVKNVHASRTDLFNTLSILFRG